MSNCLQRARVELDDLIGKPYRDNGRGPKFYDCLGLILEVLKRYDVDLDPSIDPSEYWNLFVPVDYGPPRPGDVMFFDAGPTNERGHLGVFIGEGRFIHCTRKIGVCIMRETHIPPKMKFMGYYRYTG